MVSAQIPALQSAVNSSGVVLGIIAQPFAELSCDEKDVPLVNYGESGPMRCPRCRAYANPAFQWIGGGEECICNFCNYVMEVPQTIYVVFIIVPAATSRPSGPDGSSTERPPGFCFVVDSGYYSVASGMFHQIIASMRTLLPYMSTASEICLSSALFACPHSRQEAVQRLLDLVVREVESSRSPAVTTDRSPGWRKAELMPKNPKLWSDLLAECVANADGEALHFDIARAVTKAAAYGCVVQARVSRGLCIERHLSRWSQTASRHPAVPDPRGGFLFEFPVAFLFLMRRVFLLVRKVFVGRFSIYVDEDLPARYAYFQLAVLHHNAEGIR
ncbi:hypothetical protein Pmar_PMAR010234 [Perkinsus marinus ATCC 50983]|uniref:Zinc finger Sec23/Sec24-type domain-containing protein n=1 Tax=Perkinsus marinus (strain ATCC 50983 / TXsc) TaxID=423536 RepID=C5K569_PERM5|nr:hypothetical protein Pmar_PMAR010234 [Perkinsus marinus ATCC 50983]EER20491.1 hypothetical protein Pmar_PMAR010234 [Perkinsus marinus ATCC 50983]|eukprot:XP_002788695.1 hypothetical protein Pmar_PMAR010234 [Perkinsus marinus ATCC 50983]